MSITETQVEIISSEEGQMLFVGQADVMMAYANNDRWDMARRIARKLHKQKVKDGITTLPEFTRAVGQVCAIEETW